jgi:hypothetical protein
VNLDNLTKEEKEYALKILKEYSNTGTSEAYNQLLLVDYKEIPVDIYTFLHDKKYLGRGLIDEEGRYTLFKYWEDLLIKIYPDSLKPPICNTLALTGAIGIGKSTVAVIIGLYELYRLLCLRNPYVFYHIMNNDVITFALLNITMDASARVGWSKIQNLLQMSDWFLANGSLTRSLQPEWKSKDGKVELIFGSRTEHIIGRAVMWCFIDEISFQPNQDVETQKKKAQDLVSAATTRMQSRFMRNNIDPTILVIASSKRTEQSYMETWIAKKKEQDNKSTIIVDEPQWVIRDDKKSKDTFKVAIGNKFMNSEIVPDNATEEEINYYKDRGYTLINVPIGYKTNFIDDIDRALNEVAGISNTELSNFISGERINAAKISDIENIFTKDVIEVGNNPNDATQYYDYFDLSRIPQGMLSKPLFIHLDMSITGDKTGIAGVWIKGKDDHGEPIYQLAFSVSIKAPKGNQVSFEKTRQFIYYLKSKGFKIKYITMDTFQSADMLQVLRGANYNVEILSVDRVDKSDVGSMPTCKPYVFLKNAIYEKKLLIPQKGTQLLTSELVGLERNNNSGKIDHSPRGINSKDQADAVCGAIYTASLHVNEFVLDYARIVNDFIDDSPDENTLIQNEIDNMMKQQLNVQNYQPNTERFTSNVYVDDDFFIW